MHTSHTAADTSILDRSILDDLRAVDDAIVADLVAMFVGDVPDRIGRIRTTLITGSADQVAREAHGLKGSALAVGATHLAALCRSLEEDARTGQLGMDPSRCDALQVSFDDVCVVLRAMC